MIVLLLSLLAIASPDQPEKVPEYDVSAFADRMVVLSDSDGHLVAFDGDNPRDQVFYGDKEGLYALQIQGSSASGDERWSVTALDFRSPRRQTGVTFKEGHYEMSCADATRALEPLAKAEAARIVSKATFYQHRWRRNAVAAYRDEYGVYYFIDRATGDDLTADHRVYVGWQGQILRSPLKLLASDSLGRVYSAGNGVRRLVITGDKARYIEGDKERELLKLDLFMDGPYIYTDLGIYGDAVHGTPCDVLLAETTR